MRLKNALTDAEAIKIYPMVVRLADRHHYNNKFISKEELISVGCVALAEAGRKFDKKHGVKLSTFAYRRIQGAMIDALEKANRQNGALNFEDIDTLEVVALDSFLDDLENKDLVRHVMQLVETALPEEQAMIIVRHYFEKLPFGKIAAELRVPRWHIVTLHNSALARLQQTLSTKKAEN